MHFSTMEARLKEAWKPLLNMILCIQRLAEMFGATGISGFCMMKIFKKTVVIVHKILKSNENYIRLRDLKDILNIDYDEINKKVIVDVK